MSLNQLVLFTEPVRSCQIVSSMNQLNQRTSISSFRIITEQEKKDYSQSIEQKIPKELWRMIHDLYENAMKIKDLFLRF